MAALLVVGASFAMVTGGHFDSRPLASAGPGASPGSGNRTPGPGGSSGTPPAGGDPTPTPASGPAGPALTQLDNPFVRVGSVDVTGTLPGDLVRAASMRIRIYVDRKISRQVKLPDGPTFLVKAVPLKVGRHEIAASIGGPDGETSRSDPMVVTVDTSPPVLQLGSPQEGAVVYVDHATVSGKLLGGNQIDIVNQTSDTTALAVPTPDGVFSAEIPLSLGVNALVVTGRDLAGNPTTRHVRMVRAEGKPSVDLTISSTRIKIARLPASVTLEATVLDEAQLPVADAPVTFTLSPPGLPTSTYHAQTDATGVARWDHVALSPDGAIAGKGFATVLVTLPGTTRTLQQTAPFTFE